MDTRHSLRFSRLLVVCLGLSTIIHQPSTASAATIIWNFQNTAGGSLSNKTFTIWPAEIKTNGNAIISMDRIAARTGADALATNTLLAGNYYYQFDGPWTNTAGYIVVGTNASYQAANIWTNLNPTLAVTTAYSKAQSDARYVARNSGSGTNLTLAGTNTFTGGINFGGEIRTNWPTGGSGTTYTNTTDPAGVIAGGGLGTNLLAYATTSFVATVVQPSVLTTNSVLANAVTRGAIYVSASLGSDTNASPGPFATLAYAQSVATNGNTIVVTDGSFSETGLGKSGVKWNFADGTLIFGADAGVFSLTNGDLFVTGLATASNCIVFCGGATNATADIELKQWIAGSAKYAINVGTTSNSVINIILKSASGGTGARFLSLASDQTSLGKFSFTGPSIQANPTLATGLLGTNRNTVVSVSANPWKPSANNPFGNATGPVNLTMRLSGEYDLAGYTQTASYMGTNLWFKGVSIRSASQWALDCATNTHGTFYFEAERLLFNNP